MKKKINTYLIGISILAILATVVGITLVSYSILGEQIKHDLAVEAAILKDTKCFESTDTNTEEIDLSTASEDLRVTWISEDGIVLYDNDVEANTLGNHKQRPEIRDAFANGSGESVRNSDTMNYNTFYYAVLLDNGTVLRVSTEAKSILAVFVSALPLIILIVVLVIVLCIILTRSMSRQIIKPIENMAENLDDVNMRAPYSELAPFASMIRQQHADIISAAQMRQEFTANVSHELKTPLTAISGYAELLESGMAGEEQRTHFYTQIRRNSERLISLINDTIKLSDLDRNDREQAFEVVDFYELAHDSVESLKINASSKSVTLNFDGIPCSVLGSRELLRELLENLIQNAIQYNNPGGKVDISIKNDDGICLIVEDNGIGIPRDQQDRIFERFYRVDKSRSKETGGTGLGLAIVKHIAQLHEAELELDSEVGQGTKISVHFKK